MKRTWWKESVVYQIYPRSFCDSNGDGIGDIPGIIDKLDYLQTLGIDIIWLSPVYQSPGDDNGYDISDYRAILPEFGTMEDFDKLLAEAHKRDIKIIMDLVVNHTSDEHQWFIESRSAMERSAKGTASPDDSPYKDFYIWREGSDGQPPNNWGSWFGGPAWEYDEPSGMYYLHIFSRKQPDLNWENSAVRDAVYDMMAWWLDKGIDGFRMDVISLISKVPGLPDGDTDGDQYGNLNPYCINGPRAHEFLQEMNQKVLSKYDIMTVGETPGVTLEEAKKYAGEDRGELDTVFQFEHVDISGTYGKWTNERFELKHLKEVFGKWQTGLAGIGWNALFWSNHDQPRAVSRFGCDQEYREVSAKMLGTCLHMMQGTPYIYQGEELGMTNAGFDSLSDYRDIETLNAYDEYVHQRGLAHEQMIDYLMHISRDNARTPMQWDDGPNAGFSSAQPWIRPVDNYKTINASQQLQDPDSVFHYYQNLIRLRHEYDVIVYGSFRMLMEDSDAIFAYQRVLDEQQLYVYCNFTDQNVTYDHPLEESTILLGNYTDQASGQLRPYEAVVFIV